MKPDKTISIKGEVCPYTFVKSKLAIEDMKSGQILEIILDHPPACENVPKSMENEGNSVISVSKINSTDWRILIRRS